MMVAVEFSGYSLWSVYVKSDVEVVRKTTEDSVEDVGKSSKYSETEIRNIIYNLKGDGFKNNPLRQAYENEVAGLKAYGGELLTSGMSEEQVARTLNQARRDLGIKVKRKSNMDIIKSSSTPNSNIDNLLLGFEEWLRRQ